MNYSTSVNNDGTNKCCEYKFVTIQKYFIDIGIVSATRCATCALIDLQLTLKNKSNTVKYLNSIRGVKHDVYGKRQTAKIELLVSDFSRLYNLGKLFPFTVIKGFFSYFSTGFI